VVEMCSALLAVLLCIICSGLIQHVDPVGIYGSAVQRRVNVQWSAAEHHEP